MPGIGTTTRRFLRRRTRTRRGALILEMVIVLPIMLIALLAIVQFGFYFENMQQVSLAARIAAEVASQTPNLPDADGDPVPENVRRAVEQHLASCGISGVAIRLEHNTGGEPVVLRYPTVDSGLSLTKLDDPPPGRYVRATVVVPTCELMPDALSVVGLNLAGPEKRTAFTQTFRYEID